MIQISVQSLPLDLINYLISKIQKHESRYPWMLEQDGSRKLQFLNKKIKTLKF